MDGVTVKWGQNHAGCIVYCTDGQDPEHDRRVYCLEFFFLFQLLFCAFVLFRIIVFGYVIVGTVVELDVCLNFWYELLQYVLYGLSGCIVVCADGVFFDLVTYI